MGLVVRSCMRKDGNKSSRKYGYPKQYSLEITTNDEGFPTYSRRNTSEKLKVKGAQLDNRLVIPYNPYLSILFDCHVNVDVCSTIKVVKYLYKYVYKDHDKISYNVVPAKVHLPNQQTLQLHSHERLNAVVANSKRHQTQLTEFFAKNAAVLDKTGYLYSEFCEHYTWDASAKESPVSFVALRTVNGILCKCFQEAAVKLGLLEENDLPTPCMAEACEPSDPCTLWSKFYSSLSEDFSHEFPTDLVKVQMLTARSVDHHLEALGKSLSEYGLDNMNEEPDSEFKRTKDIIDALDAPISKECLHCRRQLNSAQKAGFDDIMQHVHKNKPATSGIAAANIPSGRTTHSRFKISIDSEASLDLCENKSLFGGKLMVFGGDFKQVLPIVPQKTQREAVEISIVSSYIWPKLKKFKLTENIRAREDPDYCSFLLSLGNGKLQQTESSYVRLPSEIVRSIPVDGDLVKELITSTFPEIGTYSFTAEIFTKRAILTPTNDDVDSINTFFIDSFPGNPFVYKNFDTILDDMCTVYPTEFLISCALAK
ncbi:uncharacterized protein LOC110728479 [Chenopodium quinoa]|uniref:uncharacterized protein LOC110728479 n=1 Tax=Chenopodium quinoa TaxID=63459 RepID=UPI000B77D39B|nr:uncharacterized protein LOC110728479 [Chenopodium quinoa]